MVQLEINKKYRERHKRLGLCSSCSRKAKAGMVHCGECLRRRRERWKAQHSVYCPECSKLLKPVERIGGRFHKLCAQKRRAIKYPPQHRLANLAYYERHRRLGLCYNCPRKVFKGGLCRKHHKMGQDRYYDRAVSRSISLQQPSVTKVKARSI